MKIKENHETSSHFIYLLLSDAVEYILYRIQNRWKCVISIDYVCILFVVDASTVI